LIGWLVGWWAVVGSVCACCSDPPLQVLVTGASAGFRDGKFTGGWWNVKNSWGDWGDGGYIKIEMDYDPGAKGCVC
jgi:hypothetical protein